MPSLTGKLLASAVQHLVADSRQMSLVGQTDRGAVVDFDGALRISLGLRGEQIAVTLLPIRGKCSPNHIWATEAQLDKAFLAATKAVLRIAYTKGPST